MEKIQVFQNAEFGEIRTVIINNEPWFVGKDVAEILGYSNPQKALRDHVDEEDKTVNESFTVNGTKGVLINESGLYSLILSSKMPNAKKFKHWVTAEVLPAIRRHGAYMTEDTLEKALTSPDFLIQLATKLKEEQEKNKALTEDNARMKPKEIFADAVAASNTSILIGELAKLLSQNGYATGQNRLFTILRDRGYLIKSGTSKNMPTQSSMERGLFEIKETIIHNLDGSIRISKTPKVTGKGQQYFINKFLGEEERW
ncbi:MAG: phage antirepressor [Eubacteriales bacterium]|nr:phage antirepressor [Eubacteriales bacterium]